MNPYCLLFDVLISLALLVGRYDIVFLPYRIIQAEGLTKNFLMVNGLHLYSAFLTSVHSQRLTILPFTHSSTPMAVSAMEGDSQLVRSS